MCFTVPKKIISRQGQKASLDDASEVDLSLLGEPCAVGDYVQVEGVFAVAKVTPKEAGKTRQLIKQQL